MSNTPYVYVASRVLGVLVPLLRGDNKEAMALDLGKGKTNNNNQYLPSLCHPCVMYEPAAAILCS